MIAFRVTAIALLTAWAASASAQDVLPELPPEPGQTVAATSTMPDGEVEVRLDLAAVIQIPPGTETLALGNPAIADVTEPRAGSFTVVTGKSYGTTNMLALDRNGTVLHQTMIHVKAPRDNTLTVMRGTLRETWSCLPNCEPTVTLGDAPEYFGGGTGQIDGRNGLAKR